jgi:hypothetical protein
MLQDCRIYVGRIVKNRKKIFISILFIICDIFDFVLQNYNLIIYVIGIQVDISIFRIYFIYNFIGDFYDISQCIFG